MLRTRALIIVACLFAMACQLQLEEPVHVADGISATRLMALKAGMSYDAVEALVGPPLCVVEYQLHDPVPGQYREKEVWPSDCATRPLRTTHVPTHLRNLPELMISYAEPRRLYNEPAVLMRFDHGHLELVFIKTSDSDGYRIQGVRDNVIWGVASEERLRQVLGR